MQSPFGGSVRRHAFDQTSGRVATKRNFHELWDRIRRKQPPDVQPHLRATLVTVVRASLDQLGDPLHLLDEVARHWYRCRDLRRRHSETSNDRRRWRILGGWRVPTQHRVQRENADQHEDTDTDNEEAFVGAMMVYCRSESRY